MAATDGSDAGTVSGELADLEAREKEIGVRKAVLKAQIARGTEPPEGATDFDQWSACLYRELRPVGPPLAPEGAPEAKGEPGAELAVA